MISYLIAGLLGTINMICWGVYGDLLVEKFSVLKVVRSLVIGLGYSILLYFWLPGTSLFLVSLSVIALERLTSEIYKFFIRKQGTKKYRIPANLSSPKIFFRRLFGVLLVALLGLLVCKVQFPVFLENYWLLMLIAGFLYAFIGYTKDIAIEKLNLAKFLRSPSLAIVAGIIILFAFPVLPAGKLFLLSTIGLERIFSGFYRKVLKKDLPAKFQGQKEAPAWRDNRKYLLIFYGLDIICLVMLFLIK